MNWCHLTTVKQIMEHERHRGAPEPEFFVEYLAEGKCLGIRTLMPEELEPERIIGAWGERTVTLTTPMTLQRGHRETTIKPSPRKPIMARERLYALNIQ